MAAAMAGSMTRWLADRNDGEALARLRCASRRRPTFPSIWQLPILQCTT